LFIDKFSWFLVSNKKSNHKVQGKSKKKKQVYFYNNTQIYLYLKNGRGF